MKIIMSYYDSDNFGEVICYDNIDNIDKFTKDLSILVDGFIKKYNKELQKYLNYCDGMNKKTGDEYRRAFADRPLPKSKYQEVNFHGHTLRLHDFTRLIDDGFLEVRLPEIQTLEDWFIDHLPGNI